MKNVTINEPCVDRIFKGNTGVHKPINSVIVLSKFIQNVRQFLKAKRCRITDTFSISLSTTNLLINFTFVKF